jgi:nucleotide-binding universal stress UspA family protein
MTTRRILLAVSTSRYSQHLVAQAITEAIRIRDAGEEVVIDVLTIIETQELERISAKVGDSGFLGLDPQAEVLRTLGEEHNRMALRRVDEIKQAAADADFPVNEHRVKGKFVDHVLAFAEQLKSDVILITRADRPFISRILFGSEADKVARLALRDGLGKVIIPED